MSEDTLKSLGKLISGNEQRDAVHIAIAPCVAGEKLEPGTHVGFVPDGTGRVVSGCDEPVGVVDPFLRAPVKADQRFWLFLYPGTITSLRHEWTHAVLDSALDPDDAEKAIHVIAEKMDIGYSTLMAGADEWLRTHDGKWGGEYLVEYGSEHWQDTFPSLAAQFWRNYEKVRGISVPDDRKESFFSCSC